MVKRVKGIHVQFEPCALAEIEIFAEAHIPVVYAGLAQEVTRCVAVHTDRRLSKAAYIQALEFACEITVNIAARSQVRALELCVKKAGRIRRSDAEWKSGLECGDARDLPTANRQIGDAIHSAGKFLAASERELVNVAGYKAMVDIEVRRTVVQRRIVVVHGALITAAGCADSGCGGLVVLAVGPGIDRGHGQIVSAMFKLDVHRVVMGVTVEVAVDIEPGEVRIRQPA